MNVECIYCGVFHWLDEHLTKSSSKNPRFGKCCQNEKVILPLLHDSPLYLKQLFEYDNDISKEFHKIFNSIMQHMPYDILLCVQEENRLNKDLSVYLHYNGVNDKHHYNLPTANVIAVILSGDGSSPKAMHDIII
ncbi:1197_t:CDS:2 [Cetraspora pellucida]|uniref:1197_t:CDS:1 n=1 Tax=Cetraspora pellucida TaxID=1433469 RepID=A0ACA9LG79_9GLOM|nr:1197_t:CDS:2 [Cetraspora pellucida]